MNRTSALGLAAAVTIAIGAAGAAYAGQRQEAAEAAAAGAAVQPVSWDGWLAAKAKAEENDAAGNLVSALQYYLEYIRQAEGLNNPSRIAWGKNNAAYMIIKMHRQDPTVELAPARKLLEEGLGVDGATEECRKVLAMNLEYVKSTAGTPPRP